MLNDKKMLRRRRRETEDMDPMAGVANLSDVMLVFACGLMVAIILNWHVDLTKSKVEVLDSQQLQEVEDPEKVVQYAEDAQTYQEMGTIYEDPETGKLYVIMPMEEE